MNSNIKEAKIVLVCGYRRTGKDTLYSILSKQIRSVNLFKWRIYRLSSMKHEFNSGIYVRMAFADALKCEASEEYGIPLIISDTEKDVKQFKHYKSGKIVSARDIYIEWGTIKRNEDIDYWCKALINDFYALNCSSDEFKEEYSISKDPRVTCVVTDWRFENEVKYVLTTFSDVITIRVYRSDVPIPDANIDSEHDLNKYPTDILLIQDGIEGEFEKAVELFPQYHDYIACECIE